MGWVLEYEHENEDDSQRATWGSHLLMIFRVHTCVGAGRLRGWRWLAVVGDSSTFTDLLRLTLEVLTR